MKKMIIYKVAISFCPQTEQTKNKDNRPGYFVGVWTVIGTSMPGDMVKVPLG